MSNDWPLDKAIPGAKLSPNEIAARIVAFCAQSWPETRGKQCVPATLKACHLPNSDCMAGRGFLSKMTLMQLEWNEHNAADVGLPSSVVLKAPGASITNSEDDGDLDDFLIGAHRLECLAFEQFQHVHELRMPEVYYTRQFSGDEKGLIVMENLSDGVHFAPEKGATDGQVRAVLSCLAALHAECYARDDHTWRADFALDQAKNEPLWQILHTEMVPHLLDLDRKRVQPLLHSFPPDSPVKCSKAAVRHVAKLHEICDIAPVLVHGDMWSYNIMWRRDGIDEQSAGDSMRAIIDWQTAHTGSPTEDICEFLGTSVPPAMRRERTADWLRHYHHALSAFMAQRRLQPPFGVHKLQDAYEKSLPLGAAFSIYATALFISKGLVKGDSGKRFMLDICIGMMEDALKVSF